MLNVDGKDLGREPMWGAKSSSSVLGQSWSHLQDFQGETLGGSAGSEGLDVSSEGKPWIERRRQTSLACRWYFMPEPELNHRKSKHRWGGEGGCEQSPAVSHCLVFD